jgi:eukaryotic-like serine/threonine-protein kinase
MNTPEPNAQSIFAEAFRLKGAEREAYLARSCGENAALRQEVESLLAAYENPDNFLNRTLPLPEVEVALEHPGMMVGRYKLLEKIGEGGFGVVYMAEQVEPVQRKVALKIIKPGMDTRQVIARFEAERQALALMDYPNIAKVLDAGATETGRPYFVMELVRGISITEYCDQKTLSTTERLRLFIQVCHAVQHAHQKGIIHRDLKPSNILITLHDGVPVPKVIDFGVVKALGQKLTEKTLFTGYAQMLGTPAYMSPEQAELSGLDVDTRSDIYSLGVLLYELLTGVTPFDKDTLARAALDEMRRIIRENEPAKPSSRLQTLGDNIGEVAKHRGADPAVLNRLVRGDLDWIVMKCLEKDRNRRYETADGLARDLECHMANEPVSAAAPGGFYRATKFIRRNKIAVQAFGGVLSALLVGLAIALILLHRETEARDRAIRAEVQAETWSAQNRAMYVFLQETFVGVGDAAYKDRDTQLIRELMDRAAARLSKDFEDKPEVKAHLCVVIGSIYLGINELAKAETLVAEALVTGEKVKSQEVARAIRLRALVEQASMRLMQGRLEEAERACREGVRMTARVGDRPAGLHPEKEGQRFASGPVLDPFHEVGEKSIRALRQLLAMTLLRQRRMAEAEALFWEYLAYCENPNSRLKASDVRFEAASVLEVLADISQTRDKLPEAEALFRRALTNLTGEVGEPAQDLAMHIQHRLGVVLWRQNKEQEAEAFLRKARTLARKLLRERPATAGDILNDAVFFLLERGEVEEAEQLNTEVLGVFEQLYPNGHQELARAAIHFAAIKVHRGQLDAAAKASREAAAMCKKLYPAGNLEIAEMLCERSRLPEYLHRPYEDVGNWAAVEPLALEALAITRKSLPDKAGLREFLERARDVLWRQRKFLEAEPLMLEALDVAEKNFSFGVPVRFYGEWDQI